MSIFDYLQLANPDYYAETFSVNPQEIIAIPGSFKQNVFETDGGDIYTSTLNDTPQFFIGLKWNRINDIDFNTIIDFYFNKNKGFGMARSFIWLHPIDSEKYVVKFASEFSFTEKFVGQKAINEVSLRVIGRTY